MEFQGSIAQPTSGNQLDGIGQASICFHNHNQRPVVLVGIFYPNLFQAQQCQADRGAGVRGLAGQGQPPEHHRPRSATDRERSGRPSRVDWPLTALLRHPTVRSRTRTLASFRPFGPWGHHRSRLKGGSWRRPSSGRRPRLRVYVAKDSERAISQFRISQTESPTAHASRHDLHLPRDT